MKKLLCSLLVALIATAATTRAGDSVNYGPTTAAQAAAIAAKIRAIGPQIGMNAAQCMAAWGAPLKINRTTRASGTFDQWVYGNGRYLYLDNGLLVSISQ